MPSQTILKIHTSPLSNIPKNAYWLGEDEPPTLDELKCLIEDSFGKMESIFRDRYKETKDAENFIKHLGYAVSSYIDSTISNLDERMTEISALYDAYEDSDDDVNLAKIIGDKSLNLGYELQMSTQKLMRELEITGMPIDVAKLHGHQGLKELFVKHSTLFPSSWNESASYRHKTLVLLKGERLEFNRKKFSLETKTNTSSFTGNYSKVFNPERFEIVYGNDGQFAYSSVEEAERASKESPLEFHTKHEIVHEMTHMYERKDLYLGLLTESFLDGRISKDEKTGLRSFSKTYSSGENIIYNDHFPNRMCGLAKFNSLDRLNIRRNEILSRGTESILCGSNGSFIGLPEYSQKTNVVERIAPDIDYRNFMLGILFGHKK